jgi:hypothetical protein
MVKPQWMKIWAEAKFYTASGMGARVAVGEASLACGLRASFVILTINSCSLKDESA